jgi:CubicO group peptidase (beta-lactamase class C family)
MRDTVRSGLGGSLLSKSFGAATVCAALLALSACGGGGGGGSSPPPSSGSNPPPAANTAPTVDAGAAQTIQLPTDQAQLQGTATDAESSTLTLAWSQTAGPTGVTFDDATAASTIAHFPGAGTYTLSLSANDGTLSASDTVDITVNEASANTAPTVNAGDDQTVVLPNNTATLQGSATDAENDAITYAWTGPSADVTFDDATAASTVAHLPAAGSYELTLTASDGTNTATDTVTITVTDVVPPSSDEYPAVGDRNDPLRGWKVAADPAEVGMDATALAEAAAYAQGNGGGGYGAVIHRGRVAYLWGGATPSLGAPRVEVKSTTKSMAGIALGLALDDKLIASLSDKANVYLPEIGANPIENATNHADWLNEITVQQLATHTAGFEKPGGYCLIQYEPGTEWSYSDCGLNWLADLLTSVYQRDLADVLTERVWNKIGLSSADLQWRPNAVRTDGQTSTPVRRELASGIQANVNALARVGLLFLREGKWQTDQGLEQIVSKSFIDAVRTPPPEVASATNADPAGFPDAPTTYGMLWWTNAGQQLANVPPDAYWAWGLGDSLIVVIPSLDIVVVRLDDNPDAGASLNGRAGWNGDYSVLAPLLDPVVRSVQP